jgi:hypothetical protein
MKPPRRALTLVKAAPSPAELIPMPPDWKNESKTGNLGHYFNQDWTSAM